MSDGTFAELTTRERQRISSERENIRAQQRELQGQLVVIDRRDTRPPWLQARRDFSHPRR